MKFRNFLSNQLSAVKLVKSCLYNNVEIKVELLQQINKMRQKPNAKFEKAKKA